MFISEFLPDPEGKDTEGEWVELGIEGGEDLVGWKVVIGGKKLGVESGFVSGDKLLLRRPTHSLSLRNEDGEIFLYGPDGKLVDKASFFGKAVTGKSYSRTEDGFRLSKPTPLSANVLESVGFETGVHSGLGVINSGNNNPFIPSVGLALLLSLGILFVIKKNEDIQNLLFGRNQENRGRDLPESFKF